MTKRILLPALAGFIVMFITNGLMAAAVIGPLFEESYAEIVAETARFPLLILGYLIIAVAMAVLFSRLQPGQSWLAQGLIAGGLVGTAVFLGTHTVIAGYTTLDPAGFILSGLFDSLGPTLGMIAIAYTRHRGQAV